jgi:hypothetical protein
MYKTRVSIFVAKQFNAISSFTASRLFQNQSDMKPSNLVMYVEKREGKCVMNSENKLKEVKLQCFQRCVLRGSFKFLCSAI